MELSYFFCDASNALGILIVCFCAFFILAGFACFKASLAFYTKHLLLKKNFHSSEIQRFVNENYPDTTKLKSYAVLYFFFGILNLFLLSLFFNLGLKL